MENIYRDIAQRTGGNVYIGVVGPVRTGKSTLIKRIMEQLVIPNIEDMYARERARDELPQSGSGKTIMTSEPKFIPEQAAELHLEDDVRLSVRLIDSVGYMVDGAVGANEEGIPRMVTTPWLDYEIPMTEAAELGTKKVMQEHCSIGLIVTTDGTITDIPRQDYLEAEHRSIVDMQQTKKPFLVIINSREPDGIEARNAQNHIQEQYGIDAIIADCQAMTQSQITSMFKEILYTFPMHKLNVYLPGWMETLNHEHPLKNQLYKTLLEMGQQIKSLNDAHAVLSGLRQLDHVTDFSIRDMDLGSGTVSCALRFSESLFYEILSDQAGIPIKTDGQLLSLLTDLSNIKREYDQISDALASCKATGYGIVMPDADAMTLETPEVLKKGGAYGVKLKAGAPSIHMIRVDIDTQISPMVGSEAQSHELISYLCAQDPEKLWQSNIFGKSVYEMIRESLTSKLVSTPEDVREKFRGTLTKIVNDGATGLICLIL